MTTPCTSEAMREEIGHQQAFFKQMLLPFSQRLPIVSRFTPRIVVLFVAIAMIAIGGSLLWQAMTNRQRQLVFEVPPGTAARLAAGEEVNIFPSTIIIDLRQYDTLVIQNNDSAEVTIGPFRIVPGQRFVQRYWNRGVYELICSIHQGEQLRIEVR
ncbi:cupredoxin domain-containing protein [Chloroflexus sp.]|uniref:cupredoxin domain-containing protein n=1 Tax=Chloroflexus sp. TaxID=1904827 RepID=UPI00404B536B